MPISKIKTSSITADAASVNLSIDANTLFLDVTNNRVGVGHTSPGATLDVRTSTAVNYAGVFYNTSATGQGVTIRAGSTSSQDTFNCQTYDGSVSLFKVGADGNVGIGTSSPTTKLQVLGTTTSTQFRNATSSGNYGWTAGSQGAIFATNSSPGLAAQFIVDNSGRGTSISTQDDNGSSTGSQLRFGLGASTGSTGATIGVNDNTTGGYNTLTINSSQVIFNKLGSESARIDASGNLIVGNGGTAYSVAGGGTSRITLGYDQNARTQISITNQNTGSSASAALVLGSYGLDWIIENGSAANNGNLLRLKYGVNTAASIGGSSFVLGPAGYPVINRIWGSSGNPLYQLVDNYLTITTSADIVDHRVGIAFGPGGRVGSGIFANNVSTVAGNEDSTLEFYTSKEGNVNSNIVGRFGATGRFDIYTLESSNSTNSEFVVSNASGADLIVESMNNSPPAISGMRVAKVTSSGRSINASGTVNQNGADYAEYMRKSGDFVIAKGDICGIDANGELTNVFVDAVSFVVKSTNPGLVGGDTWFNEPRPKDENGKEVTSDTPEYEEWFAKMEEARAHVDRIAFCGQIPVNVTGATPGQWIIPIDDNGSIKGEAVTSPTFEQYQTAVGKVIAIEEDGRARIIVKIA